MGDAPEDKGGQGGLWQRLTRTGLWPLLLAEICFALICLAIGLVVWYDINDQLQQVQRQDLLRIHHLQASLIDQQLANQQQHLRQLGRATRRRLQSDASPSAPGLVGPAQDGVWLLPNADMAVFDDAAKLQAEQRLDLARELVDLQPLMNDLYYGDALIKRLHVSLPQGLVALVPGRNVLGLDALTLERYRFEKAGSDVPPLRWQTLPGGDDDARLALRLDVYGTPAEPLAQVGIELDSTRLAQLLQDHVSAGSRTRLVDAQGESLLGPAARILPDEAGRRGVSLVEEAEGGPGLKIWSPLPTTGWRLVSRQPVPETLKEGAALIWVVLGWGVGSLLILAVLLMAHHQRLQRWEQDLVAPATRIARFRRCLAALAPSWLNCAPSAIGTARDGSTSDAKDPPFARIDSELDALDATLATLARQPRLATLTEALSSPALLTHEGLLVAVNGAFEQIVGRSRNELLGVRREFLLAADETGDEAAVRLRDSEGRWRRLRRVWGEDGQGHGLSILVDESASRHREQQLSMACDRARQESRLKTHYLALLRRELEEALAVLEKEAPTVESEWRERLVGLLELLDSLKDGSEREVTAPPDREWRPVQDEAPRLLIVDDGPVNTVLASNVLSRQGVRVDTAAGGEAALALGERHFYDLVFMDIVMPPPDGIETSRRWRERENREGGERRSVLVALTANASEADRERFFAAGMDDYLAKPYRPQALVDMIHRWLP